MYEINNKETLLYKLYFSQKLPIGLEEAWEFFSSPANLEKITPSHLRFQIEQCHQNEKIYQGQIIAYTIRPIGNIKMHWVTEITHCHKPFSFIDEQRIGPYALWHHEHRFSAIENGVLIEDIVYYKMPFGILGKALHFFKVGRDLNAIFAYRKAALEKQFGT